MRTISVLFFILVSTLVLFSKCTMTPIALNQHIAVENPTEGYEDMEVVSSSSEAGISLSGYYGETDYESIKFIYLPMWYRKNFFKFIDLGVSGFLFVYPFFPGFYMMTGPELIIGKKPFKITGAIYGFHFAVGGGGAGAVFYPWWQTSILLGAGPKNFNSYGGVRASRYALGPLCGMSFNQEDENLSAIRFEASVLFPPPWDKEIEGTGYTMGIAYVRKF